MNKAALFLNGQAPEKFPDLAQFEKIFCTDGAYHYLKRNNIQPDFVIGDFDSMNISDVADGIETIHTPDQNYTDFEKALQIIEEKGFTEVDIYGSSGIEHDHFLGNLTTGIKFKDKLALVFFDDFSIYFFAEKKTVLENYNNRIISLYPFPFTKGITTKGLKYGLNNEDLDLLSRIGTRNTAIDDSVEINYEEGNLLVFIRNE
jgi:thiamine pyrophosphokinase